MWIAKEGVNERDDGTDQRQIFADGKFWLSSDFLRILEWARIVRQDADVN